MTSADPAVATSPGTRPALGIGLMVLAMFLFTVMDSIGKALIATYPIQQVVWARYAFQFALILLLVPRFGIGRLVRTGRPGLHIGRGLLLATATLAMFAAISVIPLADAYTITFTAPLLVTVLSIPLLGERVGLRRGTAVTLGFVGVLIVIRPGVEEVHWAMVTPLITAACFACYQILTRLVSRHPGETALVALFYPSCVGAAVMTAMAPFFWQVVALTDWPWMIAMGALAAFGHMSLIRALTIAPASLLAPFTYVQVVWALLIGYALFGDLPDVWMLLGCTVIVASGVYVLSRREARD